MDMARGVQALVNVSDSTRMRLYEALVTLSNGTMDATQQVRVCMCSYLPKQDVLIEVMWWCRRR